MRGGVGVHAADDAQPVGMLTRQMRKQFRDPGTALSVLRKLERRAEQFAFLPGAFLAGVLRELRLRIERVHLRGPAVHEQHDHPPGARRKVRRLRHQRTARIANGCRRRQSGEGRVTESGGRRLQHLPSSDRPGISVWIHAFSPFRHSRGGGNPAIVFDRLSLDARIRGHDVSLSYSRITQTLQPSTSIHRPKLAQQKQRLTECGPRGQLDRLLVLR